MISAFLLLALAAQAQPTVSPADSTLPATVVNSAPADTVRRRPRAIEYSDAYYTRLQIHRIGSYTMLPLFAGEYALGQNLMNGRPQQDWVKGAHVTVALGIATLFTINTVTGAWNLWDSRADPTGRPRRWLHTALMVASDAGFVWTGQIAGDAKHSVDAQQRHRNVALGSMALSAVGGGMMWLWKN